jgi:hypothetical protein
MFATCSFNANISLLLCKWRLVGVWRSPVARQQCRAARQHTEGRCGGSMGGGARRGRVGGTWRSLVSSPTAHRGPGVGGTGSVEGVWRREWVQHPDVGRSGWNISVDSLLQNLHTKDLFGLRLSSPSRNAALPKLQRSISSQTFGKL